MFGERVRLGAGTAALAHYYRVSLDVKSSVAVEGDRWYLSPGRREGEKA